MERKLGEIFTCNGKLYQVVKGFSCNGCAFIKNGDCYLVDKLLGPCAYTERTDKTSVIFKLINNMEIKNNQLTINIPKGMKIDLENSDLTKGIVKFKKKDITYDDILQVTDSVKLRVSTYCIDKILAISQLMNIAKYYNGNWKPDWSNINKYKYYIIYKGGDDTYEVDYNSIYTNSNIYFKNKEDAIAVINNPNFRDILDVIYKN